MARSGFPDFNVNYDAEYYDLVCEHVGPGEADVLFLRELCGRFGGPVLEICVGTGRIAIPLAYDGLKVTGIDRDEGMLRRCREKLSVAPPEVRKRVELIRADMRTFELRRKFQTIFIAFNTFLGLITRKDQLKCLERVREHLQPGRGRFILDVFNPSLDHLTRDIKLKCQEYIFRDAETGIIHEQLTTIDYNDAAQVLTIRCDISHINPDGSVKREVKDLQLKMIFPDELLLLLEYCGFKVLHRWGNYEKQDFGPGAMKQLIVAKIV